MSLNEQGNRLDARQFATSLFYKGRELTLGQQIGWPTMGSERPSQSPQSTQQDGEATEDDTTEQGKSSTDERTSNQDVEILQQERDDEITPSSPSGLKDKDGQERPMPSKDSSWIPDIEDLKIRIWKLRKLISTDDYRKMTEERENPQIPALVPDVMNMTEETENEQKPASDPDATKVEEHCEAPSTVHQVPIWLSPFDDNIIRTRYGPADIRLFFFDYDGTLTDIVQDPMKAIIPKRLFEELRRLTLDPRNLVWVVSGRSGDFLESQFNKCHRIGLVAEHGASIRMPSESKWLGLTAEVEMGWRPYVRQSFQEFTERWSGTYVEEKKTSLVLHYRSSPNQEEVAEETDLLQEWLEAKLENEGMQIIKGKCIIEARSSYINKGLAVKHIVDMTTELWGDPLDFILCIGDDVTDEDMFHALPEPDPSKQTVLKVKVAPSGQLKKDSNANFFMMDPRSVWTVIILMNDWDQNGDTFMIDKLPSQCLWPKRRDSQALNFLKSLLASGTASSKFQLPIVAPSHHLAFIATLTTHPILTTRAKTPERVEAANLALQYLHLLLRHVGTTRDVVQDAFIFANQGKVNRRGAASRRRITDEASSPATDYEEIIQSELAGTESLWHRAESFWHMVGWGFNCSILHKHRWERWHAFLEFMIGCLEMDWDARKEDSEPALEQSLILKYINSGGATNGRERKILRAVFADGSSKFVAEFGEVWRNETRTLKKEDEAKKVEAKIDIEADNYGDYMEDDDDADMEDFSAETASSPIKPDLQSKCSTQDYAKCLGGMDSVALRLRLLSLLSKVSARFPHAFTPINNLYHIFFEHIRPMPIQSFFTIMSPAGLRPFDHAAASTLTQYILCSIIAAAASPPPNDDLDQEILESHYLPFPANTNSLIDNTKVSLCVETLLRLLNQEVGLEWTPELHDRAETGIRARAVKAKGRRGRKNADGDGCDDASSWLNQSAERIRSVIEMAKI
ncbi:hypothetical protein ACLMJK_000546 [Lecanora helva]